MKYFIVLLLILCLGGCSKEEVNYSYYFTTELPMCDIISYQPITVKEKSDIIKIFKKGMAFLGEKELKKKFKIQFFYNDNAFADYYEKKSPKNKSEIWKTNAVYFYKDNLIIFRPSRYDLSILGHEIIHVITRINNIKLSDRESIAYSFEAQLKEKPNE